MISKDIQPLSVVDNKRDPKIYKFESWINHPVAQQSPCHCFLRSRRNQAVCKGWALPGEVCGSNNWSPDFKPDTGLHHCYLTLCQWGMGIVFTSSRHTKCGQPCWRVTKVAEKWELMEKAVVSSVAQFRTVKKVTLPYHQHLPRLTVYDIVYVY